MPDDFKLIPFPGNLRPDAVQPGGGDVVEAISEWLEGAKRVSERAQASSLEPDAKLGLMVHIKEITGAMLALYLDVLKDDEASQPIRAKLTAMIDNLRALSGR
ncbi:hypothetical protein [Phreatobacter oligotrophus]|jgi:hypothetical protein|uniref:Uncharacterized protein n=1 Tax=Phreatobacter oligotrophus TaxID=1122261 RepID=A0A2T4Z1I3_9HYPH|nr:hypothetical protein [Phreatobacter oligotrophus]PTM53597.1 hypothetical protein C8P69_106251 [Phreatobacter oligotrophus]